jgi:hypothetical protein
MENLKNITNITAAIIKTSQEIKGVEKTATVGSGNNQYKGVSDKDVKEIVRSAMANNGLCIVPGKINPKTTILQSIDAYGKPKQSIFTEVEPEYLLLHTSGEYLELRGYGHGIDSQDKSAGKSTTYALKYLLLYLFLIPTGKIDDADATHSDDLPTISEPGKVNAIDDEVETAKATIIVAKDKKHLEELYKSLSDKMKSNDEVNALTNRLLDDFNNKQKK